MNNVFSLRLEKHVLGGLIKNPDIFADVGGFLTEKDFYNEVHATIFLCIRSILEKNEKIDKVILSERIKNLGISFKDDVDIFDYIDGISFTQITGKATMEAAKELIVYRIRRELIQTAEKIKTNTIDADGKTADEIISEADSIYGEKTSSYTFKEEPENLFKDISVLIEERGENPNEDVGFLTPYEEFNRLFGGLRPGNIYAIASRPGQGKTTWINDLCTKTAKRNKLKALILDTEMSKEEMQFRMAASISGVPIYYLETGLWRKNAEFVKKTRAAFQQMEKMEYYHLHVGNKDIDEICSMTRRWHLSNVGRGKPCIIAYDYIKLTGEKIGQNWAEHQAIGAKVDKLKKLSEELCSPIVTAVQLNRSGENANKNSSDVIDDSSAIAGSDRLQWFASFVSIFRRKTVDEIAMDTQDSGTHKLIALKTRFQGKDAAGHHDLVKRTLPNGEEKWVRNYLNFQVTNFNIEEKGSLKDSINRQNAQFKLGDGSQNDGDIL